MCIGDACVDFFVSSFARTGQRKFCCLTVARMNSCALAGLTDRISQDLCLFLETPGPRGAQRLQQPRSELLLFLKAFDPSSSHALQVCPGPFVKLTTPDMCSQSSSRQRPVYGTLCIFGVLHLLIGLRLLCFLPDVSPSTAHYPDRIQCRCML